MLDSKVTELARTMILVQFDERRKHLRREIEQVHNEMSARGMGRSGAILTRIHELCAREVEIRAWIVWRVFARVLSSRGVDLSETLARDLKAEVEAYLPPDLTELNQIVAKAANHVRVGLLPPLSDARNHLLRKIGAEIDLFVLSLERRAEVVEGQTAPPQPVVNVYSPVSVVQTGAGSTENVI